MKFIYAQNIFYWKCKKSKIFNIFKQKFNNYIDRLHHLDDNETTPSFLPPLPPRLPPTPSILPPITPPPITPPHITPITPKEKFLIPFTLKIFLNYKKYDLFKGVLKYKNHNIAVSLH